MCLQCRWLLRAAAYRTPAYVTAKHGQACAMNSDRRIATNHRRAANVMPKLTPSTIARAAPYQPNHRRPTSHASVPRAYWTATIVPRITTNGKFPTRPPTRTSVPSDNCRRRMSHRTAGTAATMVVGTATMAIAIPRERAASQPPVPSKIHKPRPHSAKHVTNIRTPAAGGNIAKPTNNLKTAPPETRGAFMSG